MNHTEEAQAGALKPGKVLAEARYLRTDKPNSVGDVKLVSALKDGHGNSFYADPATVHPASLLDDLRAEVERHSSDAARAWHTAMTHQQERDTARRELAEAAEAVEWIRGQLRTNAVKATAIEAKNHIEQGRAILARHAQPERRKGERRKTLTGEYRFPDRMRRQGLADRRKQPAVENQQVSKFVDIVFDGPPSHEAGRFVEVENEQGHSIRFGEWLQRDDGFWALRIQQEQAVDWRAKYEALLLDYKQESEQRAYLVTRNQELYKLHAEAVEIGRAAEAECERLRLEISGYNKTVNALMEELPISRSNELEWEEEVRCAIHGQTQDIERLSVELAAASARAEATEHMLRNILARIHRDGGHYADEHGLEKASKDADQVFCDLLQRAEAAERLNEILREDRAQALKNCAEAWAKENEDLQAELAACKSDTEAAEKERDDLFISLRDVVGASSQEYLVEAATRVVRERDEALAKLEKMREHVKGWRSMKLPHRDCAYNISMLFNDSPAPEKREEWPDTPSRNEDTRNWIGIAQRRIEALEAGYSGVHSRIQGWQQGFSETVNERLESMEKRLERLEVKP